MDHFKPPQSMCMSGNLSENWRRWAQKFTLYLTAAGLEQKPEPTKIALLLHIIGDEALEVYNTMGIAQTQAADRSLDSVMQAFQAYFQPKRNVVFERHQFWTHTFVENQGIDKFVTELKLKAANCEFKDQEECLRDKIVFSITNPRLKGKLLECRELTLERAIEICKAKEIISAQTTAMASATIDSSVHAIQITPRETQQAPKYSKSTSSATLLPESSTQTKPCSRCGRQHPPQQCPAYGVECNKCKKRNHFGKMCRARNPHTNTQKPFKDVNTLFIAALEKHRVARDSSWYATLIVHGTVIEFKLDTGAEANTMPASVISQMSGVIVKPTNTMLIAYGGERIKPEGVVTLTAQAPHKTARLTFFITNVSDVPLLGKQACVQLNLLRKVCELSKPAPTTKDQLLTQYSDVFEGLGEFPGTHHIFTDSTIPPVIHGCRKIPYSITEKLKCTIDSLEQQGVISKVTKPTAWVNSLVITEKKNGSLRVCLDPRDLNKAVLRQHFSIPTPEDVISNLAGKKLFTILDEKDGYWQIKLDSESADLCTFNTPWGRYKFHRLPFGIRSASEVFQQKNFESFGDIEGVHIIADDMIIASNSKEEHDAILQRVMDRARKLKVKLNKDKHQYQVSKVHYMGHIISSEGVMPDPDKVKAISEMPSPHDKKSLQRLLGMIRYLAQYIPHEASITAPLRLLLSKDTMWQWNPEQQDAFQKLKDALVCAPVLSFFDPREPVELHADASKDGLGACLIQKNKPVIYASRALTKTEQNYAQIEKELLAIVFAFKKFHQYVFGISVMVRSDHKPLEAIVTKNLSKAPARLQRMLLQLQKYDFQIVYTPGKDMLIPDTLSRAVTIQPNAMDTEIDFDNEKVVYSIDIALALPQHLLQKLKDATESDVELSALKQMHSNGWPNRKRSADIVVQPYWPLRHEIHIDDGLVMIGDKFIIPKSCRPHMIERLHVAHQGIQRSKAQARMLMYWPNMGKDIELGVSTCNACQEMLPSNMKEPLLTHEIPSMPWTKLAADIFDLYGHSYLLVIDYFSKYPEVLRLSDKSAHSVIARLKAIFARHGIPQELVSDHVPFASHEMISFANTWDFKLTFSSPGYPQSNGMA
ncbi:uncharacterized protein K02A2.6-like [Xenopus laevis]|uniref:Gypsy retrotransposon integrase-like protein 1 n=1 Tax=Xenopus laevis TaxID=8355 RepID=A0A8J1MDN6_XENLA|nr:uncharacterized protein K02A2.6-like [Xenopus laevis]